MKKSRITPNDILFFSVSIFIIVVLWIIFNIYYAYVTSTIRPDLQLQITPIEGTFDTTTINKLKTRQAVTPLFESGTQPEASPTATLSPTPAVVTQVIPTEEITPTPPVTKLPTPTLTP
ncbi:hypothetical protein HZA75_06530 [Candidatus Roizmanbacteria bacterium]|nr:hypothetical protein [Candidatus Roizmanbacteria bacterium]